MAVEVQQEIENSRRDELGIADQVERELKIVFMGAGSGFLRAILKDVMQIPGAGRGEMVLVDIDEERLQLSEGFAHKLIDKMGTDWRITTVTDRRKALSGAHYIINCIEVSGVECVRFDNDIPLKYGVDQCIGDTTGPGGLFKALRTVPVFLDVLKDVEELCPDAWVLNYTNPMSIMCLSAWKSSSAKVVGLCHSVQGSSHNLAKWAGIPYHELKWNCAGVNHLAWFTECSHKGIDLYPMLKEMIDTSPDVFGDDIVRIDLMKHFGYYVTESSGHASEYIPYYRKRPELIKEYCRERYSGESRFYASNWPTWRQNMDQERRDQIDGKVEIETKRSWEYASYIIQAMETNNPTVIYGNVPNRGIIENLPQDGIVEVACLVNRSGVVPTYYGKLPAQCAALCDWNMRFFELAATACIEKSKEAAVHALLLDPLTAAVCSPAEIKRMTLELFNAEDAYLPGFK